MRAKKIFPPTYFFILLIVCLALHFIFPFKKIIYFPWSLLGVGLIVVGFVLNIWTDSLLKKAKTTVKPFEKSSALVTKGPFQISRHPIYLGMVLVLLGTAVFLGSATAFVPIIIMFYILERKFICYEERDMEKVFGKRYGDYKKRVRKWI